MKGGIGLGLTEVKLIGMHDLRAVRANMSTLTERSQAVCQRWCRYTHSVASFCSTSCALQALLCHSSMCPNYNRSAGQSGRQAILMCPSCPDRSWGLQDLWVKQDLKTDPIRVVLRNPLDRGISNQPLVSLLTLQEQKASSKMVRLTLSSTCRRQSTAQLFRAFPWAQPRRQLFIITRKDPLRNKPTDLFYDCYFQKSFLVRISRNYAFGSPFLLLWNGPNAWKLGSVISVAEALPPQHYRCLTPLV